MSFRRGNGHGMRRSYNYLRRDSMVVYVSREELTGGVNGRIF